MRLVGEAMMHVFDAEQSQALQETATRKGVDVPDLISHYVNTGIEADRDLKLFGTLGEVHL